MSERMATELVSVSDSTQISFHQLQDIYNTLTGKFERISHPFDRAYLVTFEDIYQLHVRVSQCCESYGARLKNESITVYHIGGAKEVFSSFDRFKLYNKSNTTPVENVSIEYNILIIPAGTDKAVPYRIRVNLVSRASLREKDSSMFIGPVSILKLIGRPDGFVSIEYVDYAAARHFLTQINEWYEALDFSHESKFLRRIQELSHWFRTLVPASLLCTGVLALGTIYSSKNQDAVLSDLLIAISQISAIAIILWLVGLVLGRLIESTVDRIQPISYVFLNKGDERLLSSS